jgi:hypothetical protein
LRKVQKSCTGTAIKVCLFEEEGKFQRILRLTDKLLAEQSKQFETEMTIEDDLGEIGDQIDEDTHQKGDLIRCHGD